LQNFHIRLAAEAVVQSDIKTRPTLPAAAGEGRGAQCVAPTGLESFPKASQGFRPGLSYVAPVGATVCAKTEGPQVSRHTSSGDLSHTRDDGAWAPTNSTADPQQQNAAFSSDGRPRALGYRPKGLRPQVSRHTSSGDLSYTRDDDAGTPTVLQQTEDSRTPRLGGPTVQQQTDGAEGKYLLEVRRLFAYTSRGGSR